MQVTKPRLVWLGMTLVLIALAAVVVTTAVLTALAPGTLEPLAVAFRPTATATLSPTRVVDTPTPTLTPLPPTTTPTPSATLIMIESATATEPPPPPPEPTATWFYVIPAQPTAIPTPVLPAVAPFPTSCDGPGRMNILLIGIDGFSNNYGRAARADTLILQGRELWRKERAHAFGAA